MSPGSSAICCSFQAMPVNRPSGMPVGPSHSSRPSARTSSDSVCPAPTYWHLPVALSTSTSAAVAYLLPGVVANSSSLVDRARSASET